MMDAEPRFWEPYRFEVGQRVRTRVSPECPSEWCRAHGDKDGTVMMTDILGDLPSDGHRFFVGIVQREDGAWTEAGWFAAIELEPLQPPDATYPGYRGAQETTREEDAAHLERTTSISTTRSESGLAIGSTSVRSTDTDGAALLAQAGPCRSNPNDMKESRPAR